MSNFDPTVSWSENEIGATDKLNRMVQNDNILYNTVPEFLYEASSGAVTEFNASQSTVLKPKMIAGHFASTGMAGTNGVSRVIKFPSGTFAAGCRPVVNVTIAGRGDQRFCIATILGTDGHSAVRNDGFRVQIYHRDGAKFTANAIVHYIAFGWQEA